LEEIARTDHWPEIKSPLYKKVIGARRPAPTGPAGELTALLSSLVRKGRKGEGKENNNNNNNKLL